MIWQNLIATYDNMCEEWNICPIAHTKILAHIGVMLDDNSNILAAAKIRQSIFAPCTVKSECRSSNTAPHLVHDKASYVTNIDVKRHSAYMEQLANYIANVDDSFCKIVFGYLQKESICNDLQSIIDLRKNPNLVITFGIKGRKENTVSPQWTKYYLSTLSQNGICAITGKPDYIPDAYPGNIRYPSDLAKLFCTKPDKLNNMPQPRVGYVASQKIIHTLQSFSSDWEEQGEIQMSDIQLYANK